MNHKNLDLWKKSVKLAGDVFRFTSTLPSIHQYGISDQMQRAVVSIASNIAEGAARGSRREFIRFLNIAAGSASEIDTHLAILREIDLFSNENLEHIQSSLTDISKMIQGLIKSLKRKLD
jgi:four helix bundle protein